MLFPHHLILLRGGGDLATGVAYRLHHAGFPVVVTELPNPLVVRRRVALATAALEGEITVESLRAVRVETLDEAWTLAATGVIPVLVAPDISLLLNSSLVTRHSSFVIVDARMAKRNIDTRITDAPLVIALGPGFTAGVDCHAVIETNRGHCLGRVIWRGAAEANTGTPGIIAGKGRERVLRATAPGTVSWRVEIGDWVREGERLGDVAGQPVVAPFDGVVRGLIAPGTVVPVGLKIGDIDPRDDISAAFTISDKALAIGGGVLEAILIALSNSERDER
ncbi:MAG TPA: selenium-dependent molybdenum cofactor biosynthesis protein YqeB [Promineifilum sp.]|nr:selenium-dependent molybdenum cofactor biosynthesis protein YqeB [Promineifilum sp.]HRO91621.1 selenium-dependent molybdenum cofactor biosynthesis protein YqeB [Promineifilum sp.]HRQ13298.1 selenium-dependent molybdenum cofactor biosynthesis protein YqeB [Promineifilum sp.]